MNTILKGTYWANSGKIYEELNLFSYFKMCLIFFKMPALQLWSLKATQCYFYFCLFCIVALLRLHFLWRKYGLFLVVQNGKQTNITYYTNIFMSNTNQMMMPDVLKVPMKMHMNFHQLSVSFSFTLNNSWVSIEVSLLRNAHISRNPLKYSKHFSTDFFSHKNSY